MANNYCQFSEEFVLKTDKQREWVRDKKYLACRLERNGCVDADKMTITELLEASEDTEWCGEGFESHLDDGNWWIHSDEYGDPGAAAEAVRDFMEKFNVPGWFVINWCASCSKPRIGEFFGGAVAVSKDEIKYWNASDLAQEFVKEHS